MKKSVLLASIVSFSMLAACQPQGNSSSILSSSSSVSSSHVHTYDWDHPTWTWSENYASATVSFHCLEDEETLTETAKITKTISKEATCLTVGEEKFIATAEVEGRSFTDQKTKTIAALGHDYDPATAKWNWAEDYSSASVTVTCRRCEAETEGHTFTANATIHSTLTSAPTCLASGIRSYVAEATIAGKKYTDQKEVSVAALGHDYDYEHPTWAWSDDLQSASVSVSCRRCAEGEEGHKKEAVATVQHRTTKAASCLEDGTETYTAEATIDGHDFSDVRTEVLAKLGHHYDLAKPTWNWSADHSSATVSVSCDRCQEGTEGHTLTQQAEVTSSLQKEPSCIAQGERIFVATAAIEGVELSDSKSAAVAALGHDYDYDHPTWVWSDDLQSASVSVSCSRCAEGEEGHTKIVAATVSNEVTEEASYTHDGLTTYHAVASVDDHLLESTKTKTIDMLVPEYYARVNVGAYTDDKLYFESLSSYDSVTTVSLKARLSGSIKSGKDGWWGFGVSQDIASANIYTGMRTVSSSSWDNEWHEIAINVNSSGYLFFICAAGEFESGSYIDIKDIVIHYGTNQEANETFANASASLFDYSKAASIWNVLTDDPVPNSAVEFYPSKANENVVFKTKTTYAALTAASFDLKVETTKSDAWWGLGLSSDPSFYPTADNAGVFRVGGAVVDWTHYSWKEMATNYWWMNITGSSAEKDKEGDWNQTKPVYLYLFASTDIASVSVDNFSFTADGKTYQENFDTGLHLFEILDSTAAKLVTRS